MPREVSEVRDVPCGGNSSVQDPIQPKNRTRNETQETDARKRWAQKRKTRTPMAETDVRGVLKS
jgi:hypothetical protein